MIRAAKARGQRRKVASLGGDKLLLYGLRGHIAAPRVLVTNGRNSSVQIPWTSIGASVANALTEAGLVFRSRLLSTYGLGVKWPYNRLIGQMTHEGAISSRSLVCRKVARWCDNCQRHDKPFLMTQTIQR